MLVTASATVFAHVSLDNVPVLRADLTIGIDRIVGRNTGFIHGRMRLRAVLAFAFLVGDDMKTFVNRFGSPTLLDRLRSRP